jgi:hypothetical protein
MKYREGQAAYFGKKGRLLLGFMIVRDYAGRENVDNDEGGFQYELIDVIVEGSTGQVNVQVTSILPENVLGHIKRIPSDVNLVY